MARGLFAYDEELLDAFPTIRAGVIEAENVTNPSSPEELRDEYRDEQRVIAERLADTLLTDLPSIAAWRRVFSQFGVKPTQYRNAAEALLRRLTKQGDIPSLGLLVDIGNLVAIRTAMPVAIFDLDGISGGITVRFAEGDESFTDLGSDEVTHPAAGEVVFVDAADEVHARRWCWRQSARSASSTTTSHALMVIEGHHQTAEGDIGSGLQDLTALLQAHQPTARIASHRLSPDQPVAAAPA